MQQVVGIVSTAQQTRIQNDDDVIDRLSSRYTVVLLVTFAIVVSMHQYVGNPITCWAPVHFTGSHMTYANSYCWVRNTYYLPWQQQIPHANEHEKRQVIPYYQWIPFILLGQAILFYMPSIVWHALNSKTGVDSDNIQAMAAKMSQAAQLGDQARTCDLLRRQINRFLETRVKEPASIDMKSCLSATFCRPCSRRFGNYLVVLFMFSKMLYIANVIGQLFVLNRILSTDFNVFGAKILSYLSHSEDWTEAPSVAFPRVTMCDFNVRRLGNLHRYTVQCVLPINLYTEKIYIFLWFWFVFVAFFSVLGFATWALRFVLRSDRIKFVRNHLRGRVVDGRPEEEMADRFLDDYLKQDGVFILRLIAHNTNNVTTTEIMCALWDHWKEKEVEKRNSPSAYSLLKAQEAGEDD